jgi:hypothetical protein
MNILTIKWSVVKLSTLEIYVNLSDQTVCSEMKPFEIVSYIVIKCSAVKRIKLKEYDLLEIKW